MPGDAIRYRAAQSLAAGKVELARVLEQLSPDRPDPSGETQHQIASVRSDLDNVPAKSQMGVVFSVEVA